MSKLKIKIIKDVSFERIIMDPIVKHPVNRKWGTLKWGLKEDGTPIEGIEFSQHLWTYNLLYWSQSISIGSNLKYGSFKLVFEDGTSQLITDEVTSYELSKSVKEIILLGPTKSQLAKLSA